MELATLWQRRQATMPVKWQRFATVDYVKLPYLQWFSLLSEA